MLSQREELTKRYRKVSWGRLYWKRGNRRYLRDFFDSDDVAVIIHAPLRTHYKSISALRDDIEQAELWEARKNAAAI